MSDHDEDDPPELEGVDVDAMLRAATVIAEMENVAGVVIDIAYGEEPYEFAIHSFVCPGCKKTHTELRHVDEQRWRWNREHADEEMFGGVDE